MSQHPLSTIPYRPGCEPTERVVASIPITPTAYLELRPRDVAEAIAILVRERDAARAELAALRHALAGGA